MRDRLNPFGVGRGGDDSRRSRPPRSSVYFSERSMLPPSTLLALLLPFLRGLLLFVLVLDADDASGDGAHLHLRDRPLRVAYVERPDETLVLALKLCALDVAGRTLERRSLRLLLRYPGLARELLLRLAPLSRPRRGCRKRRRRQRDSRNRCQ